MENYQEFKMSIIIFGDGIMIQELDGFVPKNYNQKLRYPTKQELEKIREYLDNSTNGD